MTFGRFQEKFYGRHTYALRKYDTSLTKIMDDYIPDFILYISRTSIMLRSEFTKPVLAMDVFLWWENLEATTTLP